MRLTAVVAALLLSATALSDVSRADGKDDDAAQACLDRFYAATKKGDAGAMTALLEPAERKAAKSDRDKPDAWPDGSTWTTLHRHVEGDWGLFWVKIEFGPSKEPARFGLSEAEVAVLRHGYSTTEPVLLHRVDGEWCFAFAGFAPAEIDEIFHGRPDSAPPWIVRDYLDWVVESWRKSPETHPIELDKPSEPVEIAPGKDVVFLIELKKTVRLRAVVTSEADVEPFVSIESPAGGSQGSTGTKRRAVATCQLTTGVLLLVVRTKNAGKVTVEATAAPDPERVGERLELGLAAGPFHLRSADEAEFRVTTKKKTDVAFAAIPLGETAARADFRVTCVVDRSESGQGRLTGTARVDGSATFKLRSCNELEVDVLVVAAATEGTPDLTSERPAEIDVAPGKPRFLRLADADAAAEIVLVGASPDAGAKFVRVVAGHLAPRVSGIIVYAERETHVRAAFLRR